MPLFFQQHINQDTRLAVWRIEEDESFFRETVTVDTGVTHPQKRLQHLAGRFLLRRLFPEFPVEDIRIADTRRPYLEDGSFHFSISHCGDFAAAVVSRHLRVGIDVEEATPRIRRIIPKFLHPEERAWLESDPQTGYTPDGPAEDWSPYIVPTLMWSVKEAVFKWYGDGGVDFSDHIRIRPFASAPEGRMEVTFKKGRPEALELEYRIFERLCLSWVSSAQSLPL
jgi:4'-phosphopantetheinyl transferase EntD